MVRSDHKEEVRYVTGQEGRRTERTGENSSIEPTESPMSSAGLREMPETLPLRRMFGPSVVLAGVGLASTEYILWPYVTSRVGPGLLWVVVVAILTQFFVNMEVARYTLATGESAVAGFTRLWRPWGVIFIALAVLANAWPGLAAASATAVTLAYDAGDGAVLPIAVVSLLAIGVMLTLSPVAYRIVERVQFFKVGAVLLFLVLALVFVIDVWDWQNLFVQTVEGFHQPLGVLDRAGTEGRLPEGITRVTLIALLAFVGAGGCLNLVQSNYVRERGFGMSAHVARPNSRIAGEEALAPFPQDEENLSRWREWWWRANLEHFLGFFLIVVFAVVVFSMLAYATVYNFELREGFDLILVEGAVLSGIVGPWFGTSFWVIGAVALLAANLGVVDYVGRLVADALKADLLADHRFWSERRLYAAVVWGIVLFGCSVLLGGLVSPGEMILVSASLGVVAMFVYSALLIRLNSRSLPEAIKLRGFRLGAMCWAALAFGSLSLLLAIDLIR